METAGIEPAPSFTRRFILADGNITLVDEDVVGLEKWTWRLEKSNRGGAYVVRHTQGKQGHRRIYLHRMVLGLEPGDRRSVDHINGDTLDNRRSNLRIVTTAQNAQNQGSRGGSSRHRGVTWNKTKNKWRAQAMLDGRCHNIGRFEDEDVAGVAAAIWRSRHMPYSRESDRRQSLDVVFQT